MSTTTTYGVTYHPTAPKQSPPNVEQVIKALKANGIKFIRVQWCDLTNTTRYRVLAIDYFLKIMQTPRPAISLTKASLGLAFITLAPGFSPIGEYLYVPDIYSLRRAPYAPGHATVMGWFEEKIPLPDATGTVSVAVPLCPRATLERLLAESKKAGIEFLVGFETEFILLRSTDPISAVNDHGWSVAAALGSGTVESKVLEEIADCLQDAGIELQMYHAEAAPGQFEVVTGPLSPLEAADALVTTREILYNVASKHGLRATLAPRVYNDNCGSAAHTHISVHSTEPAPASNTENLNAVEASFLASLLGHLPAVTAFTLPLPASYSRMVDGVWSGGTYVCWGTDNREAPVRLCNATSPASRNFEIKSVDGTANPYLALTALLGAGFAGIKEGKVLEVKDCGGGASAADMGEDARQALGITTRMPLSHALAREALVRDETLTNVFGEEFVAGYLSVNEAMAKGLVGKDEEDTMRRLVQYY